MNNKNTKITAFEVDVSKWYSDISLKSNLVSYGPIKGTMFFKPYGFLLWNQIRQILSKEFELLEIEEVIFPSLFPQSFLNREKNHIKGFAPEVFTVTQVGNKKLTENYILRPTSEVLFNQYFKDNLISYNELPMKLNQWVNVFRYENNTKPFLRNSEFLWQEGHTIHETEEEAKDFTLKILNLYQKFCEEILLLPVIKGMKSENEKFAGAEETYTIEILLKDGQVLQSGTSHYLGNNFSKAFDLKIQGSKNVYFHPFQTSWGVSTRLIGALIMTHSDNNGLILPSKIAPYQIVILIISFDEDSTNLIQSANDFKSKLKNFKVKIDYSKKGKGHKIQEWETKGVPLRIEIGKKELKEKKLNITKRANSEIQNVSFASINDELIQKMLNENDQIILNNAKLNLESKIVDIVELIEINENIKKGFICKCHWIESPADEEFIKKETGATLRAIVTVDKYNKAINSIEKTNKIAYFARSY